MIIITFILDLIFQVSNNNNGNYINYFPRFPNFNFKIEAKYFFFFLFLILAFFYALSSALLVQI